MTSVYDQETATAMYLREQCAIAKNEGIEQGIEQGIEKGMLKGKINTTIEFYKKNLIPLDFAAKELRMSQKEFLKMVK